MALCQGVLVIGSGALGCCVVGELHGSREGSHLGHPAELALSRTQLASAARLRAGQLGRQLGWAECGLSCRTPAEL